MTTRTVGSNTYNLTYDAENHLAGVSGAATATFVYDGDNNRVKATVGGVTTVHIGAYFEWTGSTSTMKTYYSAGGARVAVRTGSSTLSFILTDHLGSTSVTTNSSGTLLTDNRYKAWGESRYASGTLPTKFTYTGQYSNVADFGLMYYGARWYDSSLSRFAQADTIIPQPGDSQAWDRHAYALNNPIKYIDPTGHSSSSAIHDSDGDAQCNDPDHCVDARGMSILSKSSKNVSVSRVRIGARAAFQPSRTGPYSGEPIDNTCFNCSSEPKLSGTAAGVAAGPDVFNTVGTTAINLMAAYGPEAIFLYAYQADYSNGNLAVNSLEVINTTGANLSVVRAGFVVSGSPTCIGTCISPYTILIVLYLGHPYHQRMDIMDWEQYLQRIVRTST